jgi:tetratricopeptide (TPR) repeat protein
VDALYYKGTTLERMGRVDQAIEAFTFVLKQEPAHIKASYARGACQNLKGYFAEAISTSHIALASPNRTPHVEKMPLSYESVT